jgi:hypothetical protein
MLRRIRIALICAGFSALSFVPIKEADAQATALINGSFVSPPDTWMIPGIPGEGHDAIQAWYGFSPSIAGWSPNFWVFPPSYSDIWNGGMPMGSILTGMPGGNLNVVTHSHGGNVAILATYYMARPLRTLINLGTPINWDLPGYTGVATSWRCQVSSTADWVQFIGASPFQIANFVYSIYSSIQGAVAAFSALATGNYYGALAYFQYSVFEVMVAEYWWRTTKEEVVGPTLWFSGLSHADMHSAYVWNTIAPYCA